jgi:hypothetical protein
MSRTEKLLEKAHSIWEESLFQDGLPDPVDVDGYGTPRWYTFNYQRLRKILHERSQVGFASGVFNALATIGLDEKKERNKSFRDGDGI